MNSGTVLYVEDDEMDVVLMHRAWKKAGLLNPLQLVTDGEQALKYLGGEGPYADRAKHPLPFLVLLDLKLPKISGFGVLKWIRTQPSICTMQVVVLTSSNQPADIHRAHVLRVNAYLIKPPSPEGLTEMAASLKQFWVNQAQSPPDCLQFKEIEPVGS